MRHVESSLPLHGQCRGHRPASHSASGRHIETAREEGRSPRHFQCNDKLLSTCLMKALLAAVESLS